MATIYQPAPARSAEDGLTPALWGVIAWQVLLAFGLFAGAAALFNIETFFNLGAFVPRFIGVVVIGLGMVSLLAAFQLARMQNGGRLIGILMNFAGFALSIMYLAHLLGLYLGIDVLAAGVYRNAILLLGFPIGYALVWLGRKFPEGDGAHEVLQRVGLGVMMLALMVLLWRVGLPNSFVTLVQNLLQPLTLITIVVGAVFITSGILLIRTGERYGETILQREAWQGWLFLMPNFVNFMLFFALPLVLSFYLSFTDYDAVSGADWVGLDNYSRLLSMDLQMVPDGTDARQMLKTNHFEILRLDLGANDLVVGARDAVFWQSMGRTMRYCVMLLTLSILPALGLALLLNSKIPGMTFFRAVYFLPSIAAVVGVALIWQWLYDPVIGYINYAIGQVAGLFGAASPQIQWLSDESVMLISVVIMAAWQIIGFNTVIILAGLQSVPKELLEAATVDGANGWTRFRSVILPLLAPTTFFVTVTTLVSGLQVFSEMYTLFTNSVSSERYSVVYYLYQQGFQNFKLGYASATAWILFVVIFTITLVQFRLSSRNRAYSD